MQRTRQVLTILWICFFALDVGALLWLRSIGWIASDHFESALSHLNALYIPYIGLILAFHFGGIKPNRVAHGVAWLAIAVSLLWNLAVSLPMAGLLFGFGTIEAAITQVRNIGGGLSWVVAPALGYYFRGATPKAPKD
jgi:hypothetical protein